MDEPVDDVDELAAKPRDIAFANAHLGGAAPVVRTVRALGPRSVLDVGCGAGDVAVAIVRDAQRRSRAVRMTCLDVSETMLAIARRTAGSEPGIDFVRADGGALPYAGGGFDVVACTLALHHFDPDAACALLRELRRVAALSPVVCDLRRSLVAFAATWLW